VQDPAAGVERGEPTSNRHGFPVRGGRRRRVPCLRLQIANFGQAEKNVALPLRVRRTLFDQCTRNGQLFSIIGYRAGGDAGMW
jgi:hypothetical protein